MKISVLTPVLNGVDSIGKAIESVIEQNYPDYEHIIADGGSTDGTVELCRKYKNVTVYSEPDTGQSNAMNKAFNWSTGDIIVYLNADDYFYPGVFARIAEMFEQGAEFVVGYVEVKMQNGKSFINKPNVKYEKMLRHWEPNAFPNNPIGYFYTRKVQEEIGGFKEDNHLTMDLEFLIEAASRYEFIKTDLVCGVYHYYEGTKTIEAQKDPAYWDMSKFPYLENHVKRMPADFQKSFYEDRAKRYGYQAEPEGFLKRVIRKLRG